ncbi:hypothetical protein QLL95_gp0772 [Cotonvirus japonicus]|uniref:Uncharacterized protein n=1 Tax=Cotonvirus japonicus TaxID=2811091 RepID=A0ABM7NTC8_9VIRU|nr:hypothetical protein QLL95_gp0772 [Cotonvirus japonicus]BCS83351.1 hypothetical protein [Cotonvirus japonicus]
MNKTINIKDIYKLFFGKDLVTLTKIRLQDTNLLNVSKKSKNSNQHKLVIDDPNNYLTPISKKIYRSTSPKSKPHILRELLFNNEVIKTMEDNQDENDPDYQEKMENNGLGFYMEDFISVYGLCPVCGEATLRKYSQSNVPVVDLVCINKEYHLSRKECFIYQMKISVSNDYFDLQKEKIIVGSKKYGELCHTMKANAKIQDKFIVPGYICIKLNRIPSNIQEYTIDHRNSFVLVPDYNINDNQQYYHYTGELGMYGKNIISWNKYLVDIKELDFIVTHNRVLYEVFNENSMKNPYINLLNQ